MPIPIEFQIAILFLLLIVLFFVLLRMVLRVERRVKTIFNGSGETEEELKRNIIRRTAWLEAKAEELDKRVSPLEAISQVSVQKVGFLRFNPFQDTGGDNSFAIALLDLKNDGVIFSSFYTREGVRIYAKKIENGNPKQPLSGEEKKVLDQALGKSAK
ncbi:MAG: hypothetical protein A2847_02060 [Candidatus Sungbacteria bacterium RIFCSPHIGHO2_01_FULL_50_25]|uniref:DUF4446 domain-containing protein n=1 Tax=Candidatus Sungbacteria bacterium RIFCSPHIGHO2_01_FULL_50_25 TaxID=1802265 RepID=A0A1G2K679_9BACT|nr:MAG: hypothetical protein A2847_02060 [Candidatus Sungbacteria bacterium RIFCSPHIGHO2_01_FULL_50_25]